MPFDVLDLLALMREASNPNYDKSLRYCVKEEALQRKGVLDLSLIRTDKTLSFQNNPFNIKDFKEVMHAIIATPEVTSVDLSGHNLGVRGAKLIAELLGESKSVKAIYIEHNQIGEVGASILLEAFQKNETLVALDSERDCLLNSRISPLDSSTEENMYEFNESRHQEFDEQANRKGDSTLHTWAKGNAISLPLAQSINEVLLRNQRLFSQRLLAQSRKRTSEVEQADTAAFDTEIRTSAIIGSASAVALGGAGIAAGIVGWPALLPLAIGGAGVGVFRTIYNSFDAMNREMNNLHSAVQSKRSTVMHVPQYASLPSNHLRLHPHLSESSRAEEQTYVMVDKSNSKKLQ